MSADGVELIAVDGRQLRVGSWRGSARLGYLAPPAEGTVLPAATIRRAVAHLGAAGYEEVITGAVPETEIDDLLDAGFTVRERLHLLTHPMTHLDTLRSAAGRITTRRARRVDRSPVLELDHLCFQPFWQLDDDALEESLVATPVARFRITGGSRPLRRSREPVTGYSVFGWSGDRGYLQRLAVHPECRGRGLVEALIFDGLAWLSRRGVRATVVNTQEENHRALRVYRRVGFVPEPYWLVVLSADLRS
jgi:ribosomal protein S18 acetylase RimI-like enzyme